MSARPFVRFWAGQTVSQLGDRVSELALPLIAVGALHASPMQVAWLTALAWTPSLLAIVLGAWVDNRVRKRRLMVIADVARAVLLSTLPAAYLLHAVTLGQLYAVALLTGAAGVLFNTAYPPFFAHLVPRSSYVDANSKLSASRSASYVVGPAIGGILVQAVTAPIAVLADALSFVASALLIGPLRVSEPLVTPGLSLLRRSREGLTYIARHEVIRPGLCCATTLNFFTFIAGNGLLVLFASRNLGLSAGAIGLALGAGATGGVLGATVAPWLSRHLGIGRTITLGAVLFPTPLALTAMATGPTWTRTGALGTAEFLSGFGVIVLDITLNSLQTALIPDGMRSRVAGAYSTANLGVRPVGALLGGVLASFIGIRATLLVAATGGLLSLAWLLPSPIPRIRTLALDDPAAVEGSDDDSREDVEA